MLDDEAHRSSGLRRIEAVRILVTGSSGMIGTNLCLRLLDGGLTVFGVDIKDNPWTQSFPYQLQDLSLEDGLDDGGWPEDIELVVHLAAHAKVHELVQTPKEALENILIAFNVLEYCRRKGLPIVFSSSREVYGDIHRHMTEETSADFAFAESTYSASKISTEALIYSYARCYGLNYLIFRLSNVYGRYDKDLERMERVVPLFIRQISRGERVTIYGERKVLDFTYIDDCLDGLSSGIRRLAAGQVKNQTINLAYGEGNSLVRLAELIGECFGVKPEIVLEPPRLGEVTHYVADISKAKRLLGYNPRVPLEEGVRRAVAWNEENWALRARV